MKCYFKTPGGPISFLQNLQFISNSPGRPGPPFGFVPVAIASFTYFFVKHLETLLVRQPNVSMSKTSSYGKLLSVKNFCMFCYDCYSSDWRSHLYPS